MHAGVVPKHGEGDLTVLGFKHCEKGLDVLLLIACAFYLFVVDEAIDYRGCCHLRNVLASIDSRLKVDRIALWCPDLTLSAKARLRVDALV